MNCKFQLLLVCIQNLGLLSQIIKIPFENLNEYHKPIQEKKEKRKKNSKPIHCQSETSFRCRFYEPEILFLLFANLVIVHYEKY